jgi:hypothetical protein
MVRVAADSVILVLGQTAVAVLLPMDEAVTAVEWVFQPLVAMADLSIMDRRVAALEQDGLKYDNDLCTYRC